MHKCREGQFDLLNSDADDNNIAIDFDFVLIQEPFIDYVGNPKASRAWNLVKPTACARTTIPKIRSIILVNAKIKTDTWEEVEIDNGNHDITAIRLKGEFGKLTIFNLYNDIKNDTTVKILTDHLHKNRNMYTATPGNYLYVGGDFNRHHPMWEEDRNTQLLTPGHIQRAKSIIDLLARHELTQTLPKGIPTFYSIPHKNWTRPDNIFCSTNLMDAIISCDVASDHATSPGVDHLPIHTEIDIRLLRSTNKQRPNFRAVDWEEYNETLTQELTDIGVPTTPTNPQEYEDLISKLTTAIQNTTKKCAPQPNPTPYSKRWWTKDLSKMKNRMRKLAKQHHTYRTLPDHPVHDRYKAASNEYKKAIRKQKTDHWEAFLDNACDSDTPAVNWFISNPPTDGSSSRIPTLKYKTAAGHDAIATSNAAKTAALSLTFFPPKPQKSSVPPNYEYPPAVDHPFVINADRIRAQINKLSPYKAPGPDEIPNVIWQRCADQLIPYLVKIYKASVKLDVFSQRWREWTTIVLKKPGKTKYDNPKSWRPIALLNTMGKIYTALIAEDISYMTEKYQLLPKHHFGGRTGRTTTDAIHLLTNRIKTAWRRKRVVSVLFLDIEAAFPNAVPDMIAHNLRKRRIPQVYTRQIENQLAGRRTKLHFDDHESEWIPIDNGAGQGDPASGHEYIYYDADLIDDEERTLSVNEPIPTPPPPQPSPAPPTPAPQTTRPLQHQILPKPGSARQRETTEQEEDAAGYADDVWLLAEADTFEEANATILDMLERKGGALDWAETHNSRYSIPKLILVCFTDKRTPCPFRRKKTLPVHRPSIKIQNTIIKPSASCRYLGVILDQELKWKEQLATATEKATKWTLAFRRMAQPSKGLTAKLMIKLYKTVLIPKVTYAIDTWYTPVHTKQGNKKRSGSIAALKQLTKIHRSALIAITGAMKTTATDTMEAHAGLLPMELLLRKTCQRAAIRMATLPEEHPLHKPIRTCARRVVKKHPSQLHHIMALSPHLPAKLETIHPACRPPSYKLPAIINIPESREDSKKLHDEDKAKIKVYSDGSAHDGKVGAAAVLYKNNRKIKTLRYHLGSDNHYTVPNAEAVGATLAAHLILTTDLGRAKSATFNIDNQSTIKTATLRKPTTGQHLNEHFKTLLDTIRNKKSQIRLKVHWITAHDGIEGNETADKEAKKAAEGETSPNKSLPKYLQKGPLPFSATATKRQLHQTIMTHWQKAWNKSPRKRKTDKFQDDMTRSNFLRNNSHLTRKQTSILLQLRTGHAPLFDHLYRIKQVDAPGCPLCESANETVSHYIRECPTFKRERFLLRLKTGRQARNWKYLFNNKNGTEELLKYIQRTGRFKPTYGDVLTLES